LWPASHIARASQAAFINQGKGNKINQDIT
jgi:hypothetical protein